MLGVQPNDSHQRATVAVFKSPGAKIVQRLPSNDWDFALGVRIVDEIIALLRSIRDELGDKPYGFELTQQEDGTSELTAEFIVKSSVRKAHIIRLDKNLKVIDVVRLSCNDERNPDEVDFSSASEGKAIAYYEDKSLVRFYSNGYTAGCVGLDDPESRPPRPSKFRRSADNYELSVRDHYKNGVRYSQDTLHWSDRASRLLHSKQGHLKTEGIFHKSLLMWLEIHVDGDVKSEPKDTRSDEPDIYIISPEGRKYLVEIKWLGTNGSSDHGVAQFRRGLGQLSDYLKKNGSIDQGTLLVYDGRSRADFDALEMESVEEEGCIRVSKCGVVKLPARGSCLVMFLESKTASNQ